MTYLYKVFQQVKQRTDKKVSCIFKEIMTEVADYETYGELSENEKMDIYSDILFKMSL